MQDEISIELTELTKLYVVCSNEACKAELGFDMTKKNLIAQPMACPVCHQTLLDVNHLEQGLPYTWVSLVQKILQLPGKPRMFFRVPASKP